MERNGIWEIPQKSTDIDKNLRRIDKNSTCDIIRESDMVSDFFRGNEGN